MDHNQKFSVPVLAEPLEAKRKSGAESPGSRSNRPTGGEARESTKTEVSSIAEPGSRGGKVLPWPYPDVQWPYPGVPEMDPELADFCGGEWQQNWYALAYEGIKRMLADPLRYGRELDIWKLADEYLTEFRKRFPKDVLVELDLGGNRAAKTERRAKRLVENMTTNAGWKAWACQSTETASVQNQQNIVYKYLPPEWKPESGRLRHGAMTKIAYTQSGGFTENVFVCPNGSECRFKFYEMKVKNLEGAELDEAWCDELVPIDWLEALIFRLVTRAGTKVGNGILGITFTPIEGYSSTVKVHLNGATTIKEIDAELLPPGFNGACEKVPRVQENLRVDINGQKAKALIIYFHTKDNPFGGYESMKATLEGASRDKILTRAYGVPTKAMMTRFPMFADLAHVISLNRFREIQKGGGTWYHFLDPCAGRNWFQFWVFIDPSHRAFVAGESPSFDHEWAYIPGVGNPGPWAVPGNKADGEQGDGQKEWGWGYTRYLEEIDRMERILSGCLNSENIGVETIECSSIHSPPTAQKIVVSARWIDARYGNARKTSEERSTTLIEDLSEAGMDFLAAPSEKMIDSGRGGGDGSLRMINDKLFYDTTRPIDHTNQPHLFVVETCPNTIYSLKEWCGGDGQHGASKDPVDCLRMLVLSGSDFVDEALLQPRSPWRAQFSQ
jgi:phage terminase large subunit-like protein